MKVEGGPRNSRSDAFESRPDVSRRHQVLDLRLTVEAHDHGGTFCFSGEVEKLLPFSRRGETSLAPADREIQDHFSVSIFLQLRKREIFDQTATILKLFNFEHKLLK